MTDHLKLGSTAPVLFKDTGPQKLTVALIYGDATAAPAPRYFLGTPASRPGCSSGLPLVGRIHLMGGRV
jgi:hypothetical protein